MKAGQGRGKRILFSLAALALVSAFVELGSFLYFKSLIGDGALAIFTEPEPGMIQGIKKNYSQRWKQPEFTVTVKTNNIGLREDMDYHGEKVDIGFYGDSFTFGHGVDYGQRYSDLLRPHFPGKNIMSFSYLNGWTTPHYYVFMKKHPALLPDIAVIGLFPSNDLDTDMKETVITTDDAGDTVGVGCPKRAFDPLGFCETRYAHFDFLRRCWFGKLTLKAGRDVFFRQFGDVDGLVSDMERGALNETHLLGLSYLKKMKDYLEARQKRLIVFLIFRGDYAGYYPRFAGSDIGEFRERQVLPKTIMAWCEANGIECIDPTPEFKAIEGRGTRLYFEYDEHWNANGHREAAGILAGYLKKTGYR